VFWMPPSPAFGNLPCRLYYQFLPLNLCICLISIIFK
jgi:hypothetical protein